MEDLLAAAPPSAVAGKRAFECAVRNIPHTVPCSGPWRQLVVGRAGLGCHPQPYAQCEAFGGGETPIAGVPDGA